MTEQEIESTAHSHAYGLLQEIIRNQPNLFHQSAMTSEHGRRAGEHLNSLYDELVKINVKNLKATG